MKKHLEYALAQYPILEIIAIPFVIVFGWLWCVTGHEQKWTPFK